VRLYDKVVAAFEKWPQLGENAAQPKRPFRGPFNTISNHYRPTEDRDEQDHTSTLRNDFSGSRRIGSGHT
jgi:hypothetical protein